MVIGHYWKFATSSACSCSIFAMRPARLELIASNLTQKVQPRSEFLWPERRKLCANPGDQFPATRPTRPTRPFVATSDLTNKPPTRSTLAPLGEAERSTESLRTKLRVNPVNQYPVMRPTVQSVGTSDLAKKSPTQSKLANAKRMTAFATTLMALLCVEQGLGSVVSCCRAASRPTAGLSTFFRAASIDLAKIQGRATQCLIVICREYSLESTSSANPPPKGSPSTSRSPVRQPGLCTAVKAYGLYNDCGN